MKRIYKKQQGMTLIGWIIVLGLIGFFTLLILKLYPPYYGYLRVDSALSRIAQDEGLASLSERELRKRVQRKLQIDDVDDLVKAENILVKKSSP